MTAPAACPACGAAVRPESPWCTLCYADLRPKPEPEPEPAPVDPVPAPEPAPVHPVPAASQPAIPAQAADPLTAPLAALDGPTWPCSACGTPNPMERETCSACGVGFLAGARDESPLLELPVVGDMTRLGRGQRIALAGGVVLVFVVLTLLAGLIFG
jgi:hypothetical protein